MQQKDKMHPQDMRNLIIFGILSIILWMSYDHFILKPRMDQMRAAQAVQQQAAITAQKQSGMVVETEQPREDILVQTKSSRIHITNDFVKGSFSLVGARLDDLLLIEHFKTIDRTENAVVLSPAGSKHPKYIEQGWVSADKNIKTPDNKSVWRLAAGDKLAADHPITIEWNNGAGLRFERVISLNTDYGFKVIQRVINNTGQSVTLFPYALVAQRGIPEEFLGRYIVHEGPIGYFGDELYEATYGKMAKEPLTEKTDSKGWVALTSKDWLTALVPAQGTDTKFRISYTKGATEKIKDLYQADLTGSAMTAPAGGMVENEIHIFAGEKKLNLLEKYEDQWNIPHFDLAVDFGIFYFLTKPIFWILNFFYGFVGNFGVAIIMLTVLLRIMVFPLANTSFKSFAKMRTIGPQMGELREKYKDDREKLQQELVKLYQKEKVNPMAGCLPILIQIPIFFSLFKVLSNTIEMRHAPFFGWIQDLSAPDPTTVFNLFGLIPWTPPAMLMIGAWPCFMLITMIIQRKLSPPPTDKLQADMIRLLPWVSTFILAKFAAGLVIYWTFNNLFSAIQQYIIMTRMGVEVDLIGNILGRKKEPTPIEGVHVEAALVEEEIEDALGLEHAHLAEANKDKKISKPRPKKSKKKK